MFKAIIVDDELSTRNVITAILKKHFSQIEIAATAHSVETGISEIRKHDPDIVLLDIHLLDGTGFDILSEIKSYSFKLIFVTAHENYAVKAFKYSAMDYVLKPINSHELITTMNKAVNSLTQNGETKFNFYNKALNKESKRITLKTQDSIYVVNINDIVRCESDSYYTKFFLNDKSIVMVSNTLKDFENVLTEFGFFRIHQSHLINMDYFARYRKSDGGFAILKDGSEIPVSVRRRDTFLKIISGY